MTRQKFKNWVMRNYKEIDRMTEPPESWDRENEIYVTFNGGNTHYGPIPKKDIVEFEKSTRSPLEKKRKPRGTKADGSKGLDMCPDCLCYHCNGIHAFVKSPFRKKAEKRRRDGVCPSCGKRPCKCKTNINKSHYS